MDVSAMLSEMAMTAARARSAAVEAACEQALTGGQFGVSVYKDVALVDPEVPYGEIHYHQCRRDGRRY